MNKADFYFDLPDELIAQVPLADRTASRLMVVNKESGEVNHQTFSDVLNYLKKGDCLVLNNTRVIPARVFGNRESGAKVEVLLLTRLDENTYETLVYPGKKARIGHEIFFGDGILKGTVVDIIEDGKRVIKFDYEGIFEEVLDKLGEMPLPPYITEKLDDKERYQTVYSKHNGSSAAPTAGLHFTDELLEKVRTKGVEVAFVTLHVGLGTFRPVKVDDILTHQMHSEQYVVEQSQADIINNCKKNGGKIITVGTTSTRTLESCTDEKGLLQAGTGFTDIFIYPGYKFKIVDSLITNFHLPESTLIMLVSALVNRESILQAYKIAVEEKYRFFSFGDAMFITNNN